MCAHRIARVAAREASSSAVLLLAVIESGGFGAKGFERSRQRMARRVSELLRDIVGDPFRPALVDPAWLTWRDGLLVSMARRMYDVRNFADMPKLADALEEAGCSVADILNHCRSPGEHARGCHVVDLLLGKS
jgi:hypothetical protein